MKTAFFGLLICFSVAECQADVILHDESVNGDLTPFSASAPDVSQPLSLFSLQNGRNIIKGTMTFRGSPALATDIDAFAFTVPSGSQLFSIKFDASKTTGTALQFQMAFSTGVAYNYSNINNPSLPPILGFVQTPIPSVGLSTITPSVLPLGQGNYNLSYDSGLLDSNGVLPLNPFDWTATLEITAVPEPSSVLLGLPIFALLGLVPVRKMF